MTTIAVVSIVTMASIVTSFTTTSTSTINRGISSLQQLLPSSRFGGGTFGAIIPSISTTVTTTKTASDSVSIQNSGDDAVSSRILKQLEREEAKMNKKRENARKQLNKVDESLSQLQSKKQEYLMGSQKLAETPEGGNFSETAGRSAVKALAWRLIAGSVTFITSFRFSGSFSTALSIVGSDFLSKAFTMFIGERLMNKSQAGRESGSDGAGRSLVKALIWRLFAICNTLTMAIFIARDISIASKIAGFDAIFKTALMFVYERVWATIEWGKVYQVEYNL